MFFRNRLTVKFTHSFNHTEHCKNNYIISHGQNRTAIRCNVFLTVIHRLLVANWERSPFPSANHCQGQLQTPQSVKSSLFVAVTPRIFVITYRRFGTTYRSHRLEPSRPRRIRNAWPRRIGPKSFLETSVNNYQSIRNIAEEGRSHLHGGGSLKYTFNIYTNTDLEERINAINHSLIQHQSVISKASFTRRD